MKNLIFEKALENNSKGLEYCFPTDKTNKNPISAISKFSKSISLDPNEPTFYIHKAEALLEATDFPTAIIFYNMAIVKIKQAKGIPDDDDDVNHLNNLYVEKRLAATTFLYAQVLFDMKKYTEALRYLNMTLKSNWNTQAVLLRITFSLIGLKKYNEALDVICLVISKDPTNINFLIVRARIYMKIESIIALDKTHFAIKEMSEYVLSVALKYKNDSSEMMIRGNIGMAIFYISHAIELDKDDWTLYLKRGVLLSELGQFDSALFDLKQAIKEIQLKKDNEFYGITPAKEEMVWDHIGNVYNSYGIFEFRNSNFDKAIEYFTHGIKCNSKISILYKNRSDCYRTKNNLESSLNDLTTALSLDENDEDAKQKSADLHQLLGQSSFAIGEYHTAIYRFTKAIYFVKKGDYYFQRARCYQLIEKMEESHEDLKTAVELDGTNADAVGMLNRLECRKPFELEFKKTIQKTLKKPASKATMTLPALSLCVQKR